MPLTCDLEFKYLHGVHQWSKLVTCYDHIMSACTILDGTYSELADTIHLRRPSPQRVPLRQRQAATFALNVSRHVRGRFEQRISNMLFVV